MEIRPAQASEILSLTALAVESKRYWGYDDEFMELCRIELSVGADEVRNGMVFVAIQRTKAVGFYVLGTSPEPELRMLFVTPESIGKGIGRALLVDAVKMASARGWASLRIESDPHASGFYQHIGALPIGVSVSASTGRELPLFTLAASASPGPQ